MDFIREEVTHKPTKEAINNVVNSFDATTLMFLTLFLGIILNIPEEDSLLREIDENFSANIVLTGMFLYFLIRSLNNSVVKPNIRKVNKYKNFLVSALKHKDLYAIDQIENQSSPLLLLAKAYAKYNGQDVSTVLNHWIAWLLEN